MKRFRIPSGPRVQLLTGIVPPARPFVILDQILREKAPVVVVLVSRLSHAHELLATGQPLQRLKSEASPEIIWALLPPPPADEDPEDPMPERLREELECDRLGALTHLANFAASPPKNQKLVVFTTPEGLFSPAPNRAELSRMETRLKVGTKVDFMGLKEDLAGPLDYDSEAICERPGQFSPRGGLIDVYPLNGSAPVRLDFFGDELESIRTFDPTTQRSLDKVQEVTIAARGSGKARPSREALYDYFGRSVHWMIIEPAEVVDTSDAYFSVFEKIADQRATIPSLHARRAKKTDTWTGIQELETDPLCLDEAVKTLALPFFSLEPYRLQPLGTSIGVERLEEETEARKDFLRQLGAWQSEADTRIIGLVSSEGKIREIRTLINELAGDTLQVRFIAGDVTEGFFLKKTAAPAFDWLESGRPGRIVVVSEHEWLGRQVSRKPVIRQRLLPHRTRVESLLDFADLADGDYLVHLSHGICRYRGVTRMEIRGREEEVISVEFAEKVTLHVPLQDSHLLTRYVGLTRISPKLGKLGSNQWDKTRAAAEKATLDFAAEMLHLQARRANDPGLAFSPDTEWQRAFENAFPFKETPDQAQAIEDTKSDMEQPKPMDRLVCGDVGFGKTEVAIRAAFKAIMDGYQAAIMVPTTVLAQQHFDTFRERFSPYPVSVEMLSRFRNPRQQKQIVSELASGKIDVIIGTHRLLSKDIQFANLGLLVVDEEHRFGVRHKERLKQFKTEVDVLSMSATPIPRTLYLALVGARDLSVIETPPADRLPIETIVRTYDPELVKRAVNRELDRGGQVFYLHNRVQTIDSVASRLHDLVPGARIEVGHGQMSEIQLERIMTRFVAGDIDILVCTTIIENGLDIPNCNTIIIEGADRFGLSQLYQLRGRVGRFKRQAYAYLLLHRHTRMLDLARKRLTAMRQHTQLGAGFRIAMQDLELRGAGNLLGHQQSGHIAGVGFDLYCHLLRQSIQRLKGEPVAARIRGNVVLDFIKEGRSGEAGGRRDDIGFGALLDEEIAVGKIDPVSAGLPASYLPETRVRIDFYRQLAMADSLETIHSIGEALLDRMGTPPPPVERLLAVTRIRVRAEMAGIRLVETEGNRLKCLPASAKKGAYLKFSGRFPRLTGQTADLRLLEIEHYLTRLSHNNHA